MADKHTLVVGGSGMLAALCLRLAKEQGTVSVVARDLKRLSSLAGKAMPGRIRPVAADYSDAATFGCALDRLAHGKPDGVFCWVHDEVAPDAPLQAATHVRGTFWHILGSAVGDPAEPHVLSAWRERFRRHRPELIYRQIILGFVLENDRSRWLTDAEISDGVYSAAQSGDALRIVGTIDPWSRRP